MRFASNVDDKYRFTQALLDKKTLHYILKGSENDTEFITILLKVVCFLMNASDDCVRACGKANDFMAILFQTVWSQVVGRETNETKLKNCLLYILRVCYS